MMAPEPNPLLQKIGAVWAGHDLEVEFQHEVAKLLGRGNNRSFAGAQPVSFSAKHFIELRREDYYVCEKTDGIRYLMYMTEDSPEAEIHYLIDRKNNYWCVPHLHFPHQDDPTFKRFHSGTVLDGELVEDKHPDGKSEIRFLVFDCLVIDSKSLMNRPLDKRLAYFKDFIKAPYEKLFKAFPQDCASFPFKVTDKETYFAYHLEAMFKDVIPRAKQMHGNDGLIFTCKNSPYRPGTDEHILKWKPPSENTIDFLMELVWPTIEPDASDPDQSPQEDYLAFPKEFVLHVFYGNEGGEPLYERHGTLYVTPEEWEKMKAMNIPLQYQIVECYLESVSNVDGSAVNENGTSADRWRFHRFRDDKAEANHISTFNSVIDSIQDHVTEQKLIAQADDVRAAWKDRETKARAARQQGR